MALKVLASLLMIAVISGCAKRVEVAEPVSSRMPAWVYSPSGDGYIGGVGVCRSHIKGKTGQRDLAVSRAIDEIARQMGVTVSNVLKVDAKMSADASGSAVSSYSLQTVSGKEVNAFIAETWTDPITGEFYVYMKAKQ